MKKEFENAFRRFTMRAALPIYYTDWSDSLARKEAKKAADGLLEDIRPYIDWENITEQECIDLGFKRWYDDNPESDGIFLIPLYILPILPFRTKVTSINGETIVYDGFNISKNKYIKGGFLGYGIRPKKSRIKCPHCGLLI